MLRPKMTRDREVTPQAPTHQCQGTMWREETYRAMCEELAVKLRISHRGRVEQVAVLGQELRERAENEATIVA